VISSYTPTVQGLIHARRAVRIDGQSPGRIVVVAMPSTPDASNLPGVESEVTTLEQRFGSDVITLAGPEATYQSVMAALPQCRWAHFACHGISDIDSPSASHLLLHDHKRRPLTVLDVSRLRLEQAHLAFSVCLRDRSHRPNIDRRSHPLGVGVPACWLPPRDRHHVGDARPSSCAGRRPRIRRFGRQVHRHDRVHWPGRG
jgi:hypothetical protein